jgi:30S ribosomal protein S31
MDHMRFIDFLLANPRCHDNWIIAKSNRAKKKGDWNMGKGDRRTKRGKIWRGSTGNSRVKKQKKAKQGK